MADNCINQPLVSRIPDRFILNSPLVAGPHLQDSAGGRRRAEGGEEARRGGQGGTEGGRRAQRALQRVLEAPLQRVGEERFALQRERTSLKMTL